MEETYVALKDLWPYVQKEYEKSRDRHDLRGQQLCNWFLQLITCADHQKIKIEE